MKRRTFLTGVVATLVVPSGAQAAFVENQYATGPGARLGEVRVARSGQTWETVFGNRADLARLLNRQNVQLQPGQSFLVPEAGATAESMCPLPQRAKVGGGYVVIVSPQNYAWAIYGDGKRIHWGPAVCGGDWCADVGRSCRTPSGNFTITEVAGPDRRSSSYPIEAAAEGKGALMPYFMRLTAGGVGMHARYIRGAHETHGCIGMFYNDAKWLNTQVARQNTVTVMVTGY